MPGLVLTPPQVFWERICPHFVQKPLRATRWRGWRNAGERDARSLRLGELNDAEAMSDSFAADVLSEKLVKLNASQQSIENLSHWCIFHRKKAKQIVKTWEKEFFTAPKEKRVSFLYLANDIIQNSRRKGSEFVNEFWKVLSSALKDVKANGGDNGRNAVSRLINIWEERKVFGSRAQSLREVLLGDKPLPELDKHEKPEKHIEKEQPSKKPKLDGGTFHKLAKAYKEVNEGLAKEDATIEECSSATRRIAVLENEATSHVGRVRSSLADELEEQQKSLLLIIDELQTSANSRTKLVSQLKEAVFEQEQKLEQIHNQIQTARFQVQHVGAFRQNLLNGTGSDRPSETMRTAAASDDEQRKLEDAAATAARIAQFAASSSTTGTLPSLFSSFAAEELGISMQQRLESTCSVSGGDHEIPTAEAQTGTHAFPGLHTSTQYLPQEQIANIQQQQQQQQLPPTSAALYLNHFTSSTTTTTTGPAA